MRLIFFSCAVFLLITIPVLGRNVIAFLINSHTDIGLFALLLVICLFIGSIITVVTTIIDVLSEKN